MFVMLKRFYELRICVKPALVDMDQRFDFSNEDFELMKDIVDALEPFNFPVLNLCRKETTLVTAERTLELTLDILSNLDTEIAKELYEILSRRIKKQRNTGMIQPMEYLENPNYLQWPADAFGCKIDKTKIKNKAIKLIKRLFPMSNEDQSQKSK